MAGKLVSISPTRLYDFSWLGPNSSYSSLILAGIDVTEWRWASLIVRVSVADVAAVVSTGILITAMLEGMTTDDPGLTFVTTPFSGGEVSIDNTTVAPQSFVVPILPPMGSGLRILVTGSQGATTGINTAMFSVDLCLKNAGNDL